MGSDFFVRKKMEGTELKTFYPPSQVILLLSTPQCGVKGGPDVAMFRIA
jgi:hypothetical protein